MEWMFNGLWCDLGELTLFQWRVVESRTVWTTEWKYNSGPNCFFGRKTIKLTPKHQQQSTCPGSDWSASRPGSLTGLNRLLRIYNLHYVRSEWTEASTCCLSDDTFYNISLPICGRSGLFLLSRSCRRDAIVRRQTQPGQTAPKAFCLPLVHESFSVREYQ